ncbi:MAG: type VI secretion system lipoprotein TssJ [Nannocystaceae bacterium]
MFLLTAVVAVGCKSSEPTCTPEAEAYVVRTLVQASEKLNPGVNGEALPVTFRLYQLSDGSGLEALDFNMMWENAADALGGAMVAEDELTVFPGRTAMREIQPDPKTTHLLAVAIFREHVGNSWYRVYEMPRYHGEDVCVARSKDRALADPCFQVFLDGSQIDGGATSPRGFDLSVFELQCAPLPSKKPPPKSGDGEKKKKKKKKRKGLFKKKATDAVADPPQAPNKPSLPSKPALPIFGRATQAAPYVYPSTIYAGESSR